ncbi:N6-L-threonylcarbamoyladenine synthase/protein kinase Bud32 [Halorubrum alkaliphilum]|uniref:Probable bifunctional tRNA threonylcarbamoyladenosine biosynthesis protein n=1 Tax=Halorubrum alkaliphilum TaxID=261290 RepID=A0A8T4GGX0_9EURY|nr:bifunctional N(6)-L-threonylcarbamoyladenine synthase/serine/threonine protein kinase [Halorubrum alkaliphilum]MBP1922681.1 N6-L-threonylcarbamoyladenine synthase/protein kinase Bud32 [Halorubrum alkaliphilum]
MRVLGIEGTAWCASAALHDTETDETRIESNPYEPESGGIHPREAAEHMADAIPEVVDTVLSDAAAEPGDRGIDAVAFSRGPGLGPCLRVVGTAARSLAGALDVPLVGVNHMVAHLEVGRHRSGFENPVCLNASGANAHLLGYHDGRYRILGETMDAGVGNAIDKFTRHVGWSHPGGPKVEAAAVEADGGALLDLPYVVKGMDFSFSGISSAANDAYDDGEPIEEVCFALQEHVFGMLTEVSERALSLTGADELVLGGGVGQNDRLREMLDTMCAARDAEFYAPESKFLRDNAGMIAILGAKMAAAGDTLQIPESSIDPNFRPDEVPVTWRSDASSVGYGGTSDRGSREVESGSDDPAHGSRESYRDRRGAEAVVEIVEEGRVDEASRVDEGIDGGVASRLVVKRRVPKRYRHPELDRSIRRDRTVSEARLTSEARRAGVPTPLVHDVDVPNATLTLQHVGDHDLAADLDGVSKATEKRGAAEGENSRRPEGWARTVGEHLARLHSAGMVHGDPTTRNVRVGDRRLNADRTGREGVDQAAADVFLIDFGLGYHSGHVEDHAMDLHVFEGSVVATAAEPEPLIEAFESGYGEYGNREVLDRLRDVRGRGRYQ